MSGVTDVQARRTRLLLDQIAEEDGRGWQQKLAVRVGVHQTTLSKIQKGQRGVGVDVLTKLARGLGVHRDFFERASLGASPHYRDHLEDTYVEPVGAQVVHDFLAQMGDAVSDRHARELLDVRWGGLEPTFEMIRGMWLEQVARDARRAVEDRAENQAPSDLGNKRRIKGAS